MLLWRFYWKLYPLCVSSSKKLNEIEWKPWKCWHLSMLLVFPTWPRDMIYTPRPAWPTSIVIYSLIIQIPDMWLNSQIRIGARLHSPFMCLMYRNYLQRQRTHVFTLNADRCNCLGQMVVHCTRYNSTDMSENSSDHLMFDQIPLNHTETDKHKIRLRTCGDFFSTHSPCVALKLFTLW